MQQVTKQRRPRVKCQWCRKPFQPKRLGRAPKFCSASCRQAACVKRNGTWEKRQREAEKALQEWSLRKHLRESLRAEVRQELTREFIQSGLVRITGLDHVNALIAGRNEWRGNKLLDELAHDFAAAGNLEAVSAIHEWQRRAKQASGRRRSNDSQEPQRQAEVPALQPPAGPEAK
jgi:hypothetical protein